MNTNDGWRKSVYSSYEYALLLFEIPTTISSFEQARNECQSIGGDVAYVGYDTETEYRLVGFFLLLH